MDLISTALLAISLSMDAFAVSVGNGIVIRDLKPRHALKTGLFFGIFQAFMPIIGYWAGRSIITYIVDYDHWIAFGLLAVIGGKMIWDGLYEGKDAYSTGDRDPTRTGWLLILAVATSIDALAAGISLAMVNASTIFSALFIGCTTFTLSTLGVWIGKRLGPLFQTRAELIGGLVLIGIGIKILVEHLYA